MMSNGARFKGFMAAILAGSALSAPLPAAAQIEPFIGQMMQTGVNFCPRGWTTASGQILSIAQNTALFSLLGTTYGGNGQTTFALPDMRGRAAIHTGQGSGLSFYQLGQVSGSEGVTLTVANLPKHDHQGLVLTMNAPANTTVASGSSLANSSNNSYSTEAPDRNVMALNAISVGFAGGSQSMPVRPPFLAMNWCVALEGIFPSRN